MIHYKKIILVLIAIFSIMSCGKMNSENESNTESDNNIEKDSAEISTFPKKDSDYTDTTMEGSETKGSILSEPDFTKKREEKIVNKTTTKEKELGTPVVKNTSTTAIESEVKKVSTPSNFTIQKILNGCKTGETLTQEELSKNLEIPKDAIKLVKNITKISENEIDVKWNSTWAVEKISDAKFKDGRLKVRFENNKMYTSGDAIGIKYKRKIYTDLVVYGRAARIPSVKGFYWKIGRD
jgi:hypothetical protein